MCQNSWKKAFFRNFKTSTNFILQNNSIPSEKNVSLSGFDAFFAKWKSI